MDKEHLFPLYNLDVGLSLVRPQLEDLRFGPFSIDFVEDYESKVRELTQPLQLQTSMKFGGGEVIGDEIQAEPVYARDWICTAHALHKGAEEKSFLAASPINDGGLWDLCELLTFFTGRRVTADPYKVRHGAAYRYVGKGIKICYQAIHAVAHAWPNRERFVEAKLEMALLSQNQAVFDMIQTQASHYTTALDIVCAQYRPKAANAVENVRIDKKTKSRLKDAVEKAVYECEGLTDSQKQSYVRVLSARMDQGLAKGFVAKLEDVLVDFGAVDVPVLTEVKERIRFIDRIRNAIIHNGRLPTPAKDETQEALGQRVAIIVNDIIPEINRQAFYRAFGFDSEDRQKFALDESPLREFFVQGRLGPIIQQMSDLSILDKLFGELNCDTDEDDGD